MPAAELSLVIPVYNEAESLAELRDIMNAVKARAADAVARACLYHIQQAGQAGIDALPPDDLSGD